MNSRLFLYPLENCPHFAEKFIESSAVRIVFVFFVSWAQLCWSALRLWWQGRPKQIWPGSSNGPIAVKMLVVDIVWDTKGLPCQNLQQPGKRYYSKEREASTSLLHLTGSLKNIVIGWELILNVIITSTSRFGGSRAKSSLRDRFRQEIVFIKNVVETSMVTHLSSDSF